MPTKGVYSHIIEPNRYVNPMDLNIYMQGEQHKENVAKENLQLLSSAFGDLSNIPAYGVDAQELQKEMGNVKSQLSSVNLSNLTDPNSFSQLNSIINNAKNNSKILAIAERGSNYKRMLEEKAEFEKRGKIYVNRGLSQLNKYYSGNTFNEKLRVGNDGYAAYNAGEIMEEVKKSMTPDEKRVLMSNGQYTIQKYYDPVKLRQAFDIVTASHPNWEKQHRDMLEDALEGKDVNEYARQTYQPLLETNYNNYNTAIALYQKTKDQKYLQDAVTAKAEIENLSAILNNPYNGEAFKKDMLKRQKEADINAMAQALNFHQEGEIKMDEAHKMQQEHSHDFAIKAQESANRQKEELFRQQAELFGGLTKTEQDLVLKQGNFDGVDLSKAYQTIESNKRKNAEAANPNISKRYENVIDYIREGAVKGGAEEKNVVSITKNNIDYFKKAGFKNIKGIDNVYIDENGDYIVDFDRVTIDQLEIPIGIKNNTIGDEVKFTKEEMARIHELGTGKRKLEDLNNSNTKESTSIIGAIPKKDLIKYKTVTTVDPSTLKKGDINLIDGYPYQWNGTSYDSLKVTE